jgi:hypothetical protein
VLEQIEAERKNIIATAAQLQRDLSATERKRLSQLSTARVEQYLDSGAGACRLKDPAVAALVSQALRHFDGKRHRLLRGALCRITSTSSFVSLRHTRLIWSSIHGSRSLLSEHATSFLSTGHCGNANTTTIFCAAKQNSSVQ